MVFTALFSWFFLDDYYLSYARLYPVNMAYTDRSTMFNMNGGVDIPYFGDKDDVSRVLTTANSAELAQEKPTITIYQLLNPIIRL